MYAEVIHGGHTISQTKIQDISGQLSRNGQETEAKISGHISNLTKNIFQT